MQRRSISWVVLVSVALAGVVAMSATAAGAARSAAGSFELVAIDRYEGACPDCVPTPGVPYSHVGTFTAGAPFCESGSIDDVGAGSTRGGFIRRYACAEGSGSLTLDERTTQARVGDWVIVEGSGPYAALRGKGSFHWEQLGEDPWVYVTTLGGVADADAVPPTIAFTSASAKKLRRGWYSIRLALSLRDDVEGNPVAYTLKVVEGPEHARDRNRTDLEFREGSTATGSASTALEVYPSSKRVRSVQLLLTGSDPVGNEVSIVRWLKLPR